MYIYSDITAVKVLLKVSWDINTNISIYMQSENNYVL